MDASSQKQDADLKGLVGRIVASYRSDARTHHLDSTFLPNRAKTIQVIELLRRLVFPGYFDEERITTAAVEGYVEGLLKEIYGLLSRQVHEALRYEGNRAGGKSKDQTSHVSGARVEEIMAAFMERLPEVRRLLATDVQAAFDGDPAAATTDEIVFCYPGLDAIFIHRVAHEVWKLGVPLLPRMMSEYAHNETGIDIHPGAEIGESFFIDHGTGVVIGETTVIGKRVKIYQGVTLGALSTKGGQAWKGRKRHPTIEDDVTIYGGAIILGGATVIGRGATIGGTVFITSSVPAGYTVNVKQPELRMTARHPRRRKSDREEGGLTDDADPFSQDFHI